MIRFKKPVKSYLTYFSHRPPFPLVQKRNMKLLKYIDKAYVYVSFHSELLQFHLNCNFEDAFCWAVSVQTNNKSKNKNWLKATLSKVAWQTLQHCAGSPVSLRWGSCQRWLPGGPCCCFTGGGRRPPPPAAGPFMLIGSFAVFRCRHFGEHLPCLRISHWL